MSVRAKKIWMCLSAPSMKRVPVWQYAGDLKIEGNILEFFSPLLVEREITKVELGKFGSDYINLWIKCSFEDGDSVFLADGRLLGWYGNLIGTRQLYRDINIELAKK